MQPSDAAGHTGFYGKLPALGDFVQRRLPASFVGALDRWLQGALTASRECLGEDWQQIYLNSPIWRFACTDGVCGPGVWLGILLPSVDRVGRCYPLTLACAMPDRTVPWTLMDAAWFEAAEALALDGIEPEGFALEAWDQALAALPAPVAMAWPTARLAGQGPWRIDLPAPTAAPRWPGAMLHGWLQDTLPAYSLWWTAGSERVAPCALLCPGLPPLQGYTGLLGGPWDARIWQELNR